MKAVIKWTLWQRRWSTMWWSVAVFGLIFINMIFYPSFKDQAEELEKSFANLSESTLQFIGGSADFFSPVGFLNSQIFFLMLPMILGILAIGMGNSLIGKEVQDQTIESLLARPVSRAKLLLGKAVTGIVILAGVSVVGLLTTLISAKVVDLEVPPKLIVLASAACFLLVLSFGAVAFLLSSFGKTKGASIGIATLVALGGYIVVSLAGTVSWLQTPSKIFPFHYYQPEAILRETFNWANIWYFIVLTAACMVLSWLSFRRRDIY